MSLRSWAAISIIAISQLITSQKAHAFPEFIGIGYAACITCHYNGAGGGPLSDYGRSLFAMEVASKHFNARVSDEKKAESSGFLGTVKSPRWLKPYAKYRQLYMENSSATGSKSSRNIVMQASLGLTSILTEDEKYILSGELGYVPVPSGASANRAEENRQWISREYYLRATVAENNWIYVGFLDKAFGIRTPDHTAVSRARLNLGQNDQAHGLMWYQTGEKHDFWLSLFAGNLNQNSEVRAKGLSSSVEWELKEKLRLGFSLLTQQNEFVKSYRLSNYWKRGLGKGHAILLELGLLKDEPIRNTDERQGVFSIAMASMRIQQGFYLQSQGEYLKERMIANDPEIFKWGLGFMYFPVQRIELRGQIIQSRVINVEAVERDSLSWQSQLHLSF